MWHAHPARVFTGGTPVPLEQKRLRANHSKPFFFTSKTRGSSKLAITRARYGGRAGTGGHYRCSSVEGSSNRLALDQPDPTKKLCSATKMRQLVFMNPDFLSSLTLLSAISILQFLKHATAR